MKLNWLLGGIAIFCVSSLPHHVAADDSQISQVQQETTKAERYKVEAAQDKSKARKMHRKAVVEEKAGQLNAASDADRAASKDYKNAAVEAKKADQAIDRANNTASTNNSNK